MGATLQDVARLAGVSIATASRTLNPDNLYPVAAETQARVLEAARQLAYQSNDGAQRFLRHRGEGTQYTYGIGLIMSERTFKFSDPFWSLVIEGINAELTRQGFHLRFALVLDDLQDPQHRRLVDPLYIDGLILLGEAAAKARLEGPIQGHQMVVVDAALPHHLPPGSPPIDVVTIEKGQALREIVAHLVATGHQRLAFVGPSRLSGTEDERADAFFAALAQHGLPSATPASIECLWTTESAYTAVKAVLEQGDYHFDALVCAGDTLAIGTMRAIKECGLAIPKNIAVTGFDDVSFASELDPPLTTVFVPKEAIGELAARKIVERIRNPNIPPVTQIVSTQLIIRKSSL